MVTSVYLLILIIIIAVMIVGHMQIQQMRIIEKIQQKIYVRFAFAFAEKIPRIDIKGTDQYYLPEKINRFFDTLNVQKGISKLLLDIPTATIQIFFGLILLSLYHPLFIAFSLLLVAVLWVIYTITGKKGLKTSITESNHKYEVVAWLEELGRVIKSFKYSQGSHLNLRKTDEKLLQYVNARTSHFQVLLFQFKTLVVFKVGITAFMLILGTSLLFEQKINIGQFVAAEIVILTIINAIEKLIASLENVYDVVTGLYKVDSLLELPEEKDGLFQFKSEELSISIKNMTFSYSDNQEILSDISMQIPANAITCISGEENSGKSTLLKLLTGSYMDFKGSIYFNNIPLQNYSLESLRSNMGILLYEQDLFEGTLYENISLGRSDIYVEDIMAVASELRIENFISFFPDSFETQLDPAGRKLPSSLIRKILLLRALINRPVLLILEEPWLGFDEDTKQHIQQYLLQLAKTRTIVISTRDVNFIERCTVKFHIADGTIQG
jgi:ATP-binding cassette, subfamily B, bacterial